MAIPIRTITAAAIGIALAGMVTIAGAARPAPQKTVWTPAEVLPLTCMQAWVKAKKSYPEMVKIVRTLARVSLTNRGLGFPNTREAGMEAGKGIAADCKADPHLLLYATVDARVRQIAEATTKP